MNTAQAIETLPCENILSFTPLGSGQEVGRSCHILSFKGKRIMLDCGIHPGMQSAESLPLIDFVECESIDIMLITHFHLDHCGALPWLLQKTAFRGRCFMTHATKAIYRMLIGDFIKIAKFGGEGGKQALFTEDDLERTMEKIECIDYHEQKEVNGIRFWCYVAGHVLGACMFMIEIDNVRVLYTGDFSRQEDRHLCAAELPSVKPDILVCESTYGTQVHEPREEREERFTKFVYDVVRRGGRCLIPAFALGRAQELLLILDEFWELHPELHEIPVYYASALAKKCMAVYQTFVGAMNEHVQNQIGTKNNPFVFKHVSNLKSMDHFDDVGPCVVLASPGMLQNGLSRDLFEMWCPDPKNGCIIAGYCVEGTLAKHILSEPEEIVSLGGQRLPVRLQIGYMSFSAHTDYEQTSDFIRQVRPSHLILVHGEMTQMNRLKAAIIREYEDDKTYNIQVHNPRNTESVSLTFHGERNAKVVGQMAAKLTATDDFIGGILLRRNFNLHLMAPDELSSYSDLANSRLMQTQALRYTNSVPLLVYNLRQISTDLMLCKPEKAYPIEGMNGTQPDQVIEIFKGSITVLIYRDLQMLILQWMSNPINDMFADSVLTGILHAQTNPVPDKFLPAMPLSNDRLKDLIVDSLKEVCGESAEIKSSEDTIHLKVDEHEAEIHLYPMKVKCSYPNLLHLITAITDKAEKIVASVVKRAVDVNMAIANKVKDRQLKKTRKQLRRQQKRGKLKRHVIDDLTEVEIRRKTPSLKRAANFEEDWVDDRQYKFAEEDDEDTLPLDMLDADIDWENSAFAGKRRRLLRKRDEEEEDNEEMRQFSAIKQEEGMKDMLPIKMSDGRVLARKGEIEKFSDDEKDDKEEDESEEIADKNKPEKVDEFAGLSAIEMIAKRKELLESTRQEISNMSLKLLSNPQEHIYRLRDLYKLSSGQDVHHLIRDNIMRLATVSLTQVFIDIIPGYHIRPPTEDEKKQKMKKETKKLMEFEQTLVRYYLKFLQHLEKFALKLMPRDRKTFDEKSSDVKMSALTVKCLSRLLNGAAHFNYATNIVECLVRICVSNYTPAVEDSCAALAQMFKDDYIFKMSLHGAKTIANLINQKASAVSPLLIRTLLSLNIKEVQKTDEKSKVPDLKKKRYQLAKERKSKSATKYKKQLQKLENDLKEAEATESMSTKLKYATDTMNHVFMTYFRVLKRMPTAALLDPVLEGLSKFAHLLNIEFFTDIISCLEELIDQKHLRVTDSIHCVHTVFVILSGEGQALNIDPFQFYKTMYRLLNNLPFQKKEDQDRQVQLVIKTLDRMINARRKQISLLRVAAFVKRIIAVGFMMTTRCQLALLAAVRTYFVAHPRLSSLVDEEQEVITNGIFRPDMEDPDCSNALSTTIIPELQKLQKHPEKLVQQFALNIWKNLPNAGHAQLNGQYTSMKPWNWFDEERQTWVQKPDIVHFEREINAFVGKKKELNSNTYQGIVQKWISPAL